MDKKIGFGQRPDNGLACCLCGVVRRQTVVVSLAFVLVTAIPMSHSARAQNSPALPPYQVGNDRGGYLVDRLSELARLRSSKQRVEIRGRICYSTCTMLLGLPQTCVSPQTIFGFHGPSRNGKRLSTAEFEKYSSVMAENYPRPLRRWFMTKARNRIHGVHKVRGEQIIRMGIKACDV